MGSGIPPALDGQRPPFHHSVAWAIKGAVHRNSLFLQRHGRRNDFEGGTRVVCIRHCFVLPLRLQNLIAPRLVFLFVCNGGQLRGLGFVGDNKRLIGVKIPFGGHAQDSAGIHLHHNAGNPVGGQIVVGRNFQILFQIMLNHLVDGQHKVVAVLRFVIHFVIKGHFLALGVGRSNRPAGHAGQILIVFRLDAGQSLVIWAHKPQHLSGEIAEGIIPLGVRRHVDTGDFRLFFLSFFPVFVVGLYFFVVLFFECPHLVGDFLFHPPGDHLVSGIFFGGFGVDVVILQLQNIR